MNWFWSVSPLVWAGAVLGVAILLVILGLRGRRIGREPRCRRCGYELTGLQSANCPECGRVDVLKRPRIGVRRRRWGLLCVGTVVLLAIGSTGAWMLADSNWRVVAPTWLLIAAFEGKDDLSGTELDARINRGSLTESERSRIIRYALAVQASAPLRSTHLTSAFKLLENFDRLDQLNDEEWLRMLKQSLRSVTVRARPSTSVGDPLLAKVDVDLAGPAGLYVVLHITAVDAPDATFPNCPMLLPNPRSFPVDVPALVLPHDLDVGEHDIEFEFNLRSLLGVRYAARSDLPSRRKQLPAPPPTFPSGYIELSGEVELTTNVRQTVYSSVRVTRAESNEDVEGVTGDDVRRAVHDAFQFEFVTGDETDRSRTSSPGGRGLQLSLLKNDLPWPILYDVILRQADRRIPWGTFSKRPEELEARHTLWRHVEGLETGSVWVELTPRLQDTRYSVDARVVTESIELGPVDYVPFQPTSTQGAETAEPG